MGAFQHGRTHGKGHMEYVSGNTYTGDWMNGKYEGHGALIFKSGERYEITHSYDMFCVFSFLLQTFI